MPSHQNADAMPVIFDENDESGCCSVILQLISILNRLTGMAILQSSSTRTSMAILTISSLPMTAG